ncbi:hypothetical protein Tco_1409695 [Tanacetum coccineum]
MTKKGKVSKEEKRTAMWKKGLKDGNSCFIVWRKPIIKRRTSSRRIKKVNNEVVVQKEVGQEEVVVQKEVQEEVVQEKVDLAEDEEELSEEDEDLIHE